MDNTGFTEQNQPIEEAYRERPTRPIRLRIQPQIFRTRKDQPSGVYRFWRDVHWTLDFDTPKEVFAAREALRVFFKVLPKLGPEAMITVLKGVKLVPVGHE